jgi:hypothetical protein
MKSPPDIRVLARIISSQLMLFALIIGSRAHSDASTSKMVTGNTRSDEDFDQRRMPCYRPLTREIERYHSKLDHDQFTHK